MLTANNEVTTFGNMALCLWTEERRFIFEKPRENLLPGNWLSGLQGPASTTYRRGDGLLSHNLQGVDHRDVAKPPGNGEGRVPVLAGGRCEQGINKSLHTSQGLYVSTCFAYMKPKASVSSVPSHCHTENAVSSETYLARNPPNLFLLIQQSLAYYTQNLRGFLMFWVIKKTNTISLSIQTWTWRHTHTLPIRWQDSLSVKH